MAIISPTRIYRVPWNDREMEIRLPADAVTSEIRFTDLPALSDPPAALRRALDEPIGRPALANLVWPGCKVALLTGDRMTDVMLGSRDGLGQVILDYLNRAGVRDEDVTLVFAPGTHPWRNADEKLGPRLIGRVGRYVKHNAFDDAQLAFVGYTSAGNSIWLNRAVTDADVVIGVGEISPNGHAGWCGGGKILVPGVAGRATVEQNHRTLMSPDCQTGLADGNRLRRDIEEAADLANLTFKIDVLVNSDQQIVEIYSGEHRQEHRAALPKAREIWMTQMDPVDIAVYHPGDGRDRYLESSLWISLDSAFLATKPDGVIVFVNAAPGGYATESGGLPFREDVPSRDLFKRSSAEIARLMIDSAGNVRTSSMIFAMKRVLEQRSVILVSEGIDPAEAQALGFAGSYRSIEPALDHARALKGNAATMATCFPRGIQWRIMPWREG